MFVCVVRGECYLERVWSDGDGRVYELRLEIFLGAVITEAAAGTGGVTPLAAPPTAASAITANTNIGTTDTETPTTNTSG